MAVAFEVAVKETFVSLTQTEKMKVVSAFIAEFRPTAKNKDELRNTLLTKRGSTHFAEKLMYGAGKRKEAIAAFARKYGLAGVRETKSFVANY